MIRIQLPEGISLWKLQKLRFWLWIFSLSMTPIAIFGFSLVPQDSKPVLAQSLGFAALAWAIFALVLMNLANARQELEHSHGFSTAPVDHSLPDNFTQSLAIACSKSGVLLCRADQVKAVHSWRDVELLASIARMRIKTEVPEVVEMPRYPKKDLDLASSSGIAEPIWAKPEYEGFRELYFSLTRIEMP